jgi:exopolysaccharide biosynthesis polyprenyl glycosylphosphotransferase
LADGRTASPVGRSAELEALLPPGWSEFLSDASEGPAAARRYEATKRLLDILLGSVLLLLTLPLCLLTAAAIKLTSRGPVLFRQRRVGRGGRVFTMYKFRSMYADAEARRVRCELANEMDGPVFKIADDPRITPLGRWLRRSSIDELPQLFNVLRGEMSLVGPRPLWEAEEERVRGAAELRTLVKPGLTCLWQISGRSELSYEHWVRLDLFYIRNRSTALDLMILVQTIPAVLSARGAF